MQELVPVQLNLGSSHGTDWLLWPVGALEEVPDFAAGLLQDLGVPPQFHRPVAESILGQVSEWVGSVPQPPPPPVPEQRRELVRCGGGFATAAVAPCRLELSSMRLLLPFLLSPSRHQPAPPTVPAAACTRQEQQQTMPQHARRYLPLFQAG